MLEDEDSEFSVLEDDEDEFEEDEEFDEDTSTKKGIRGKFENLINKIKKKKDHQINEPKESKNYLSSNTVTNILQDRIPGLAKILKNKKNDEVDSELNHENDENIEKEPVKKKFEFKIKYVTYVLIIVAVWLYLDEDNVNVENSTPVPTTKVESNKIKNPPVVEEEIPPVVEEEIPPVVEEEIPPVVEEEIPPVVEEVIPPVVEEVIPPAVEEEIPSVSIDNSDDQGEVNPTNDLDSEITSIGEDQKIENNELIDTMNPDMLKSDIASDITKKLLSDLEVKLKEERSEIKAVEITKPVSAPSYEDIGVGLVYNCKDKHWACIEQTNYSQCRGNYSWNKSSSIPIECYPYAVLDNVEDCSKVQQEKINTVGDTSFCAK